MSNWSHHWRRSWRGGPWWQARWAWGGAHVWPGRARSFGDEIRWTVEDAMDAVREAASQAWECARDATDWVDDTDGFAPDDDGFPR